MDLLAVAPFHAHIESPMSSAFGIFFSSNGHDYDGDDDDDESHCTYVSFRWGIDSAHAN